MSLLAICVVALGLLAVAVFAAAGERPERMYAAAAALPLVLTIVLPLPFALLSHPAGWVRAAIVEISWLGIATSCVFFAAGIVLAIRALLRGKRRAAFAFAIETFVAGLPAAIIGVYALLNR